MCARGRASTRLVQLHAQKWEEAHWDDASMQERKGRGSNSVYVYVQHLKNHLWKELAFTRLSLLLLVLRLLLLCALAFHALLKSTDRSRTLLLSRTMVAVEFGEPLRQLRADTRGSRKSFIANHDPRTIASEGNITWRATPLELFL